MAEFLIEVLKGNEVTHVVNVNIKNRKEATLSVASESGYKYCTKFKNKETAKKVADKFEGARVVPSFGGYVNSQKSAVAPAQGKVNSRTHFADTMTAYRGSKY
jgi:hypothetical protein